MKHETKITVRSYELDFFRHVNNAVYVQYLELARVEMLEKVGFHLSDFYDSTILPVVVNLNVNYRRPAFVNDHLSLMTHISHIGNSSFKMHHECYNQTQSALSFDADCVLAMMDVQSGKSVPIPDTLRRALHSKLTV